MHVAFAPWHLLVVIGPSCVLPLLVQVGGSVGVCTEDAAETGGAVLAAGSGVCTALVMFLTLYSGYVQLYSALFDITVQ